MLSHIKAITDSLLALLQFTYSANRSVDNAVNMAFHFILFVFILCDSPVHTVEFHFLGTIITQDLKWEHKKSSITKKALWQLNKFNLPKTMMMHFYTTIVESILTSSITMRYAAATAKDKGRLQHIIHSAEKVIGCNLPYRNELHASRTLKRAGKIAADVPQSDTPLWQEAASGPKHHATRTDSSRLRLASSARTGTPTDTKGLNALH